MDLPLLSCVQWLYLSSVLGEECVNLVTREDEKIETGKINLLPVSFIRSLELVPDMFISTHALDESTKIAQEQVIQKRWLDATHILLAYGTRSDFKPVEAKLSHNSCVIEKEANLRSTIIAYR